MPVSMIIYHDPGLVVINPGTRAPGAGSILATAPAIQKIGPHGTVIAAGASYLSRSLEELGVL